MRPYLHSVLKRYWIAMLWAGLIALQIRSGALPAGRASPAQGVRAAADMPIYADALAAGWQDWPWDTSGSGPALSVDAAADQHPISPYIYGMNFASEAIAADLRLPVRRWGGNSTTRYNWQLDVHNTGSDWYFQNIPEDNPHPELLPSGSATDRFVEQDRRTGTKTILTAPLVGWTPNRNHLHIRHLLDPTSGQPVRDSGERRGHVLRPGQRTHAVE